MSPPKPKGSVAGVMSRPGRAARGVMQPDPDVAAFDWSKDGVAFLWLVAVMLGCVVWIGLLQHGIGRH
jgi:hypothetical protein